MYKHWKTTKFLSQKAKYQVSHLSDEKLNSCYYYLTSYDILSILHLYLSKMVPHPGGEHGPRHFPKPFMLRSKFQLRRNLVEDGSEVSAYLHSQHASVLGLKASGMTSSPCIFSLHVLRKHKTKGKTHNTVAVLFLNRSHIACFTSPNSSLFQSRQLSQERAGLRCRTFLGESRNSS